MQTRNVPATGSRYWAALSVASVFGANLGDFVSRILGLGHARGLLPLALVFGVILLAERRGRPSQAYYWLAIVTLRTAATNLGDLATHDFGLGYGGVVAGLALLLLVVLGTGAGRASGASGMPATDARYWAGMLIAGTLGTAVGDGVAGAMGLGVVVASVLLGAILVALLALRSQVANKASYWSVVVAVRSAGTTVGDLVAHTLGLAPSTAATGLLLAGLLAVWAQPGADPQASGAVGDAPRRQTAR